MGSGPVTAEYSGDANFVTATAGPLTQDILPVNTSVALGTSSTPSVVSRAITLSATVSAALGTAAGTVQFFSGDTAISGLLPLDGGKATFSTSALGVGSYALTARFQPADGTFAGSTSPQLTQVVNKAAPGITLTVDVAAAGQPSTMRAAVTRPDGVAVEPGGTVTFKVNGATVGTGTVVGGVATGSVVLPTGASSVTAEFGGDGNFTTGAATTTATVGGVTPSGQKPSLVGYKEFGVGAGAGRSPDARFFNPDGSERFTAVGLFGGTGGVRVTSADFNGDGVADLVAGTGPGGPSRVVVLDGKSRTQLFAVDPFEASFTGGVYRVGRRPDRGRQGRTWSSARTSGGGPRVRVFTGSRHAHPAGRLLRHRRPGLPGRRPDGHRPTSPATGWAT